MVGYKGGGSFSFFYYDEKAVIDMLNEKLTVKGFGGVEKCLPLKKEKSDIIFVQKDIEQVNLCLGFPGMGQTAENYFAATMAGNIKKMLKNTFPRKNAGFLFLKKQNKTLFFL